MADNPLLQQALDHVEMGFAVVSVWSTHPDGRCRCGDPHDGSRKLKAESIGKHPIPPKGFLAASRDPKKVTAMMNIASMPNYGVVWPGDAPEIVAIIDVDGAGWSDTLKDLATKYGPLDPTKTTRTPSGGIHLYYRWPDGLPIPDGNHLFGFVTRWPGKGIAVGPGSRINGYTYGSVGTVEIVDFPRSWAEGALAGTTNTEPLITVTDGTGFVVPDEIPEGSRHDTIRDFIASRWNKGLPKKEIEASIRALIVPKMTPPISEERLRVEIDEGFETAERKWQTPGGSREYGEPPPTTPTSTADNDFPQPPDPIAFEGTAGEIVKLMDGHTTADPVALLATTLTVLGALCPRYLDFHGRQPTALLTGLPAETGQGKGTSMTFISNAMTQVFGLWSKHRLDGMGSGEGFVRALVSRQMGSKDKAGNYVVPPMDPVNVVAIEEELASFMAKRGREGSSLDYEVRKSFDVALLRTGKSNDEVYLDPPYWFASVGHITPGELRATIGSLSNGSANRWLWLPVRRLGQRTDGEFPTVPDELRARVREARDRSVKDHRTPLILLPDAHDLIDRYFEWIMALPGSHDLTTRLPVIALRLAAIHTVIDGYIAINADYVARGIALTEYARSGLAWVFGPATGNPDADTLAIAVRESDEGLTGKDVERLLRIATPRRLAVERLVAMGLIRVEKRVGPSGGRPVLLHLWTGPALGPPERFCP